MKNKMTKKRLFAFFSVVLVLVTVLCVPAFADEGQQLGNTTVSYTGNLADLLGSGWSPSQDVQQWLFQNPYTIVIDLQGVYEAFSNDFFNTVMSVDFAQFYGGSLADAIPSSVLRSKWSCDVDYDEMPESYLIVGLQGDTVSIPFSEWSQTFNNRYLLIPCFWFRWGSFANDGFDYLNGPNPVFMVFNNAQWQGALNGSQQDESEIARINYNIGYQEGYQAGQEYSNSIGEGGAQLITAVVQAPVNVFTKMLNFEILGINVLGVVVALLSFALVIAILKRVI